LTQLHPNYIPITSQLHPSHLNSVSCDIDGNSTPTNKAKAKRIRRLRQSLDKRNTIMSMSMLDGMQGPSHGAPPSPVLEVGASSSSFDAGSEEMKDEELSHINIRSDTSAVANQNLTRVHIESAITLDKEITKQGVVTAATATSLSSV
jgi:hypothetical protein